MNGRLASLIMRMIASQGRDGDTMLAHINPREAEMLKASGGRGTINPNTGLPEFAEGGFGGAPSTASADPRGESTAGQGGSVGMATSPGPAQDATIGYGGSSGSGFSLGNALTLAQNALAPALGPASMGSGMLQAIYSGTPPTELTQEQVMGMVPMGSLAMAAGKGIVGLGNMLGLENQGNTAPTGAPGANDVPSGLDTFMSAYLQPAPTPVAPPQPTPEEQALAARGFYSTPSAVTPTNAIDPVLQSAMLYARG